jgi:hypothetical protein
MVMNTLYSNFHIYIRVYVYIYLYIYIYMNNIYMHNCNKYVFKHIPLFADDNKTEIYLIQTDNTRPTAAIIRK